MTQPQRNDPCPCGSGKKYKKCCMKRSATGPLGKDTAIYVVLLAVFILGLVLRYYGFRQPHGLTFDEGLYSELIAAQLKEDWTNYSTQEAYQIQTAQGVKVPEYLNRPLFKHPPLYNYLIALNYKIFGASHLSAVSVSIVTGSLMILIIFLLGHELYDKRVGLVAAVMMCFGPVHWVCSQRIWMGTTLSFWMLCGIYCFARGQTQPAFFVLSGISIGLAMLTKYPGALMLVIVGSYAVLVQRSLLGKRIYWMLWVSALVIFLPWLIWNYTVYGKLFGPIIGVHNLGSLVQHSWHELLSHIWLLAGLVLAGTVLWIGKGKIRDFFVSLSAGNLTNQKNLWRWGAVVLGGAALLVLVPLFRQLIVEAFSWDKTVVADWRNPFLDEPWSFYLTRLVELSPFYLYGYCALVLLMCGKKGDKLLLLASFWILAAFIFIGNYQTRYVLPAVPYLLLLSARVQVAVYDQLTLPWAGETKLEMNNKVLRVLMIIAFMGTNIYFIVKTIRVSRILAIGGDFGYF